MRDKFDFWIEQQARRDLQSAKLILEKGDDYGNALFLLEQSYEKMLKKIFVHCEVLIFKKNFEEVARQILGHEKAPLVIQTIIPNLFDNYKKSLMLTKERITTRFFSGDINFNDLIALTQLHTIMPSYSELLLQKQEIVDKGKQITQWTRVKQNRDNESYQTWLNFLSIIKQENFRIENFDSKFESGYARYRDKINKAFDNSVKIETTIKNATLFLSYAIGLAPLVLAYKYCRYPEKISEYNNIKVLHKSEDSIKNGLETLSKMIENLINYSDNFVSTVAQQRIIYKKNTRWKKKREKLLKKS